MTLAALAPLGSRPANQGQQVDFINRQLAQLVQAHFHGQVLGQRLEATLGQATMQRHLTAFETHFGKPPERDFWPFVTATGSLAQAAANAATDATLLACLRQRPA